jgi:hypothetical protein
MVVCRQKAKNPKRHKLKSPSKIGTAGELQFIVEQKHCIDFAAGGVPAVLSRPNLIGLLKDGSLDRPHPSPLPQERESLSSPPRPSTICPVSPRPVLLTERKSEWVIALGSTAGGRSFPLSSGERAGVRASVHTHLPNLESELVCAVKAQSKSKFVPP